MSLGDKAKEAGVLVAALALANVPFVLLQSRGLFPLLGVAMIVCGIPIALLIIRRELKLDIEALDDKNDNPRATRLINNNQREPLF
jgi:hypothetical protein